jgi:hypothetical protein
MKESELRQAENSLDSQNDFSEMIDELKRRKRKLRKNPKKYLRKNSNQLSKENPDNDRIVINSSTYRKVPCQFYRVGNCALGDNCTFSHDIEQGNPDKLCKFYLVNACQKSNCLFSHETFRFPCKYLFVSGKCNSMAGCKFSHQKLRSKKDLKIFVEENFASIRQHLKDGFVTPLTRYALENGLLHSQEDKIEPVENIHTRQLHPEHPRPVPGHPTIAPTRGIHLEALGFGNGNDLMQRIQSAFENKKRVNSDENFQEVNLTTSRPNESYFDPFL